jgi:hypothetical protein
VREASMRETLDAFLNQQQLVFTELEKNIAERSADQCQAGQEASSNQHIINFLIAQV